MEKLTLDPSLQTVAKPNRCLSYQFLTSLVFLQRWKYDEINTGLSHHLLVCGGKVQHLAEDLDNFLLVFQTWPCIHSVSLFSSVFVSCSSPHFLLSSIPLLFVFLQAHLVNLSSPGLTCYDLFPPCIHAAHSGPCTGGNQDACWSSKGQSLGWRSEKAGQDPSHSSVCTCFVGLS